MKKRINQNVPPAQGDFNLNLRFVDDRVYLNYFDVMKGNDVCCQVKDGQLLLFKYTELEVEEEDFPDDADTLEMSPISLDTFIELIRQSIENE